MEKSAAVAHLERQIRHLRLAVVGMALAGVAIMTMAATVGPGPIRATSLTILDAQGRERILLGSPVAAGAFRKRTDGATSSLVFLGEDGSDRLIVGQNPPPRINGKTYPRIGEVWGMVLHDPKGSERGGMGFIDSGRVVVALDYPNRDALGLMVDDKTGKAGLVVNYADSKAADSAIDLMVERETPRLLVRGKDGSVTSSLPPRSVK